MTLYLLIFAIFLFFISVWGLVVNRNNIIVLLLTFELMLLASSFLFLTVSLFTNEILGHFVALVILTIAAAETALGLALLSILYKVNASASMNFLMTVKE